MGYYTCPRCGGHDVYTGSAGGTTIQEVVKCRSCGEILSVNRNYTQTKEDYKFSEGCQKVVFVIYCIIIPIGMLVLYVLNKIFGSK